jgi:hypothetical protein
VPADPIRTELSSDPADYLTGPTSGDAGTEGGTTKDGAVEKFTRQSTVRATDQEQQAGGSGDSGSSGS